MKRENMPSDKKTPIRLDLAAGKNYFWCTCGKSQKQPFCDGRHRKEAPGFKSEPFSVEESGTYALCTCKQTKNPPFCDGSHINC